MILRIVVVGYFILNLFLFCTILLPGNIYPFSLITYPVLVTLSFLNLGAFIVSLFFKKNRFIAFIAFLPSLYIFNLSFSFNTGSQKNGFSVYSLNVQAFRKTNSKIRYDSSLVNQAINNGADIICFQEFMTSIKNDPSKNIVGRLKDLGYETVTLDVVPENRSYNPGMAIASKYPIINKKNIIINEFPRINQMMYADIIIEHDTVRIVNVHLYSSGIHKRGYYKNETKIEKVLWFFGKFLDGSRKRKEEINQLSDELKYCKYPILITGDFHLSPTSDNYRLLAKSYKDSFQTSGIGFGNTLNMLLSFNRIDYQWYNDKILCNHFEIQKNMKLSDHFPIMGWYILN